MNHMKIVQVIIYWLFAISIVKLCASNHLNFLQALILMILFAAYGILNYMEGHKRAAKDILEKLKEFNKRLSKRSLKGGE